MYPQAEVGGDAARQPRPRALQVHDHRARSLITGINYPWTVYQGKPNYGCDFGSNKWNSHAGVTAHSEDVRADFEAMAAAGFEVTRWFVFTDGRGGVDWNASGEIAGIADRFIDDMDAALEIAASTNVRLCLVLVDFAWLDDPARRVALESSAFLDRVLDPFLDRYGANRSIHSLDVINEPDWVTRARDRSAARRVADRESAGVRAGRRRSHSRAFVGARHARRWTGAIRARVGRCRVRSRLRSGPLVSGRALPGSRCQPVWYDRRGFGLSKPLLIGECPSDPRTHPTVICHRPTRWPII
jgi:hypothetical protein